ncbi:2-amino-4-hydroxy-6-hydroxymethyldihydropteridine diphosphokinase [Falsiroseomonas selenitidurans]|uniref:2-amino-4-hydroxy-6-hydroxymethyldihydropteridine pyrophosphokinase n=1 Tax=Falsiroseomonas selenitidurans TaxID=2716335 RepID=A0ABX1DZS7_9PROT|nr:2-amino-4-hydroxy-6-hydroxymethyldihydropteridine diphosphokinase [Falsiroseomonas selenitidurans]NKC30363.1 2-amino-4-hydroxy-6-hydroxymethyldihydropteridine diphosphokinase [Falsiroseomonas selenitidurans]
MILIALGANLPGPDGRDALATCRAAAALLDGLPGLRLRALSRWYATAPVPPSPESPDYVNGVARLSRRPGAAAPDPAALLAALQGIEQRFGRVRPYPNAPRTLDLDLIDLEGALREAPDPILPHPRAHLRGFVLAPLADVAPAWVHPRLGAPVAALLAGAEAAGVRALG